jgi:hypothetical protein
MESWPIFLDDQLPRDTMTIWLRLLLLVLVPSLLVACGDVETPPTSDSAITDDTETDDSAADDAVASG